MARDRRRREPGDVRSSSVRRPNSRRPSPSTDGRTEKRQWRDVPADPDLADDLDYEPMEFEVVRATRDGREHFMYLPEEEMLDEDAFIVADAASVCDPSEHR